MYICFEYPAKPYTAVDKAIFYQILDLEQVGGVTNQDVVLFATLW